MGPNLDLFAGGSDEPPAFEVTVYGTAQPAGSKSAFVIKSGPSAGRASVTDSNKKSKPWKNIVAQIAGDEMAGRTMFDCPLAATFTVYRARPKGHIGARGNILPSAPAYPDVKPDLLKLVRGLEDALSGVVYRDDALIVRELLIKEYGEPARVEITLYPMPAKMRDLP